MNIMPIKSAKPMSISIGDKNKIFNICVLSLAKIKNTAKTEAVDNKAMKRLL
jgi:hypothetical protein